MLSGGGDCTRVTSLPLSLSLSLYRSHLSAEMSACKVLVALVLVCLSVQALSADKTLDFGPRKLLTADAVKGTDVYAKVDKAARAVASDAAQYCSTQWCYWVTCRNARKAVGYCRNGRCVCE
jgi:hypothetical protein